MEGGRGVAGFLGLDGVSALQCVGGGEQQRANEQKRDSSAWQTFPASRGQKFPLRFFRVGTCHGWVVAKVICKILFIHLIIHHPCSCSEILCSFQATRNLVCFFEIHTRALRGSSAPLKDCCFWTSYTGSLTAWLSSVELDACYVRAEARLCVAMVLLTVLPEISLSFHQQNIASWFCLLPFWIFVIGVD